MSPETALDSSFRDPSGFIFEQDGELLRQVNRCYEEDLALLGSSGLLAELQEAGLLIEHQELGPDRGQSPDCLTVLKPERLPFVSYPYEWCFSQLRDAALTTLEIQSRALARGLCLKDASAYNIQFRHHQPVLIDTLSFEAYQEGSPWVAYRQFCQHFLAPLALMAYKDQRLSQLLATSIDGISLDLASNLLPWRSSLNPFLNIHIHMHARSQARYSDAGTQRIKENLAQKRNTLDRRGLTGILDSLKSLVEGLKPKDTVTQWQNYYQEHNYSDSSFEAKEALVCAHLERVRPGLVLDLGANVGHFSRLASSRGAFTASLDLDYQAVEINYRKVRADRETNLLPLLVNLTAPSPAIGWANRERPAIFQRQACDMVMALALIHHLAISNNVPLPKIAAFFAEIAGSAIVEFVPRGDSQVDRLLATRRDIFADYHREGFETAFEQYFAIEAVDGIDGSLRTLYLLTKR